MIFLIHYIYYSFTGFVCRISIRQTKPVKLKNLYYNIVLMIRKTRHIKFLCKKANSFQNQHLNYFNECCDIPASLALPHKFPGSVTVSAGMAENV